MTKGIYMRMDLAVELRKEQNGLNLKVLDGGLRRESSEILFLLSLALAEGEGEVAEEEEAGAWLVDRCRKGLPHPFLHSLFCCCFCLRWRIWVWDMSTGVDGAHTEAGGGGDEEGPPVGVSGKPSPPMPPGVPHKE